MTRKPRRTAAKKRPVSKSRSRPASKAKNSKPTRVDKLDTFIAAAAEALDLPLRKAWLPAIKANLKVSLQLGSVVTAFELPDDAEPGPVFRA
jgi:hypothetical protein